MHATRRSLLRNATLGLAALAIAWPAGAPSAADALAPSEWRILTIAGTPAAHDETLAFADGRASGKAACNRYFADYTVDGTKLGFGPVGATRMHCGEAMAAEDALFAALGRVAGMRRDGDRLVLTDLAGASLIELAPKS